MPERLISADKLIAWLGTTEPGDLFIDGTIGDWISVSIERGTFDPTPPVQPDIKLKLYKCPNCKDANVANAWNTATAVNYGAMEITRIDESGCMDASFVCPSCGSEEDYGRLVVYNNDQPTEKA